MTPNIGHLPHEMIVTINFPLIIMVKYLGKNTQQCVTIDLLVLRTIQSKM